MLAQSPAPPAPIYIAKSAGEERAEAVRTTNLVQAQTEMLKPVLEGLTVASNFIIQTGTSEKDRQCGSSWFKGEKKSL